ncbi:hypothetical protein NI17_000595 [Thermobifida halotolerans]|uniref:TPR repeat domain-containing protein n=1 Tax=Thermobifida halotolerans TaxID=483545 RepID=A0A399G5G6_9ACTN|nr:hypothetical protein [Thermobifida halotolerans]UOE19802.1 hypothetical protein NI17_000595 [Thermobifida halotolerans]
MASFDPQDTEADEETIRAAADDLYDVAGRIIGRSGDLRSAFTGAAVEFTDLVTEDIRSEGDYDEQLWQRSSMAVVYAAGVTDMWAEDVKWFKDKRQELIDGWEDEVADDFGVPHEPTSEPGPPPVAPGETPPERPSPTASRDAKIAEKRQERLDHYEGEAADLWEKFQERAEEKGQMLRDGPEPEHVRELVDAGVLGWAPYNIMGAESEPPLPLTEDEAVRMANNLDRYLSEDGEELDAEYAEILAALAVISLKAQEAQKNGDRLPAGEIAFLERFYAELDDAGGDHDLPYNVVEIPAHLDELDTMSDEEKDELLKVLGEGILTLSHEDLGGSFEQLPQSVRNAAVGPVDDTQTEGPMPYGYVDWADDIVGLSRLLGGTDDDLEGGEDFSVNLLSTLGHEMADPALGPPLELTSETGIPLVEAATRNIEANHALLTGDYSHPRFGTESGEVLSGLYAFEWSDDGEAVSGLTDWIPEYSRADGEAGEEQRLLAGEATAGLIKHITSNDAFAALTNTGVTVGDDGNAAFGQYNPELAESLAGIFVAYMDDFGMDVQLNEEGLAESDWVFNFDSNENLVLNEFGRARFLQYIVADEATAIDTYAAVQLHSSDQFTSYLGGEPDSYGFRVNGTEAGILNGLFEAALMNEAADRSADIEQTITERKLASDMVMASVTGPLPPPVGAPLADFLKYHGGNIVNSGISSYTVPNVSGVSGETQTVNEYELLAVKFLAEDENRDISYQDLEDIYVHGAPGRLEIPNSADEWAPGDQRRAGVEAASNILQQETVELPIGGDGETKTVTVHEAVDDYLSAYGNGYNDIQRFYASDYENFSQGNRGR